MGLMTRFTRLCKADVHGVLDQLEDKGLLINQVMREMEDELGRKEARLKEMLSCRQQGERELQNRGQEQEKLEQDLRVAIEKDRDDIARFLIRKLKPLQSYRDRLRQHLTTLDQEIAELRRLLEEQRLHFSRLQLQAREQCRRAERRQWEEGLSGLAPTAASLEPSEEEVELELLRRKGAAKGGGVK